MRPSTPVIILATCLACAPALADEDVHEEHEEHEHHHANHVAVFAGATSTLGDMSATHVTVGADFEHRLPFAHVIGVGALVDSSIGSDTETLIAGFVALHPYAGLMVLGGVGVAMTNLAKDGHLGLRAAAAYFVPLGAFSIGPEVSLDRVAGENAVVFGISAGTGF